jgi:monoamine oxidase
MRFAVPVHTVRGHCAMPAHVERHDVAIIGAGAAGISAARQLHDAGLDIVVLEARDRIGGRILTHINGRCLFPIEMGAEFIHGRAPEIRDVVQQAGLTAVDVNGRRWRTVRRHPQPFDDFWERLSGVMTRVPAQGPDRTFQAFLETNPGGRRLASDRRLARGFVEGFHGADPRLISARAVSESDPGDDQEERRTGRVLEGFDRVVWSVASPLVERVRLSSVVTSVGWEPGSVEIDVHSAERRTRRHVVARAVIVTVPLGVLKAGAGEEGAIRFEPALTEKAAVLDQLAVGNVARVVLLFHRPFWPREMDTLTFLHAERLDFQTFWTAYPLSTPAITAWSGGPSAETLVRKKASQLIDRAIASVAGAYGVPVRRVRSAFETAWLHDWAADPFARGAYSYQRAGGMEAPRNLSRPIRGTVFFAGEAADAEGATGTVHGALASGRRAAAQVMRALK